MTVAGKLQGESATEDERRGKWSWTVREMPRFRPTAGVIGTVLPLNRGFRLARKPRKGFRSARKRSRWRAFRAGLCAR